MQRLDDAAEHIGRRLRLVIFQFGQIRLLNADRFRKLRLRQISRCADLLQLFSKIHTQDLSTVNMKRILGYSCKNGKVNMVEYARISLPGGVTGPAAGRLFAV
ncbi:hypothetical protein [Duganella margarita]|uniref:hypothetical protein n=1 Tax=Duganella margarita TaxID=2692170 RepID=UPI001E594D27|nr:hypothetical protein [Duganella margarita]